MADQHTPTLQGIAADRDLWLRDAGEHYRELARCHRGVAAKCRLQYTRFEIVRLAQQYERRAEYVAGPSRRDVR
jgi:hypothetical protein